MALFYLRLRDAFLKRRKEGFLPPILLLTALCYLFPGPTWPNPLCTFSLYEYYGYDTSRQLKPLYKVTLRQRSTSFYDMELPLHPTIREKRLFSSWVFQISIAFFYAAKYNDASVPYILGMLAFCEVAFHYGNEFWGYSDLGLHQMLAGVVFPVGMFVWMYLQRDFYLAKGGWKEVVKKDEESKEVDNAKA
ncbi:hypothetical protein CC78DRAFT_530055 [Lojkania enalia]|uniref:Uncharacterized protein n=1 Tax=Lojkania enalia TaxID=147567 RepID=A0A9P4KHZ8_9PLEO|nr:hypothetical protein CC78DRAFT_530055 [Didymosphaeria enalia]